MAKSRRSEPQAAASPQRAFEAEDLPTFIEAHGFADDWNRLKLSDEDLSTLQIGIMANPTSAPVIPGTGGLRKLRFAPARWSKGKSGAVRVCYVYFKEFGIVLLVIAYAKSKRDDIPAAQKKSLRRFIQEQREEFAQKARR